jgi:preprotein translocase subunit SecY
MNLNKIIQVFKIKDLRKKILFVLAMFFVFRLMANIPVPGVDIQNLEGFFQRFQMFGLLNVFTGGTLSKLSFCRLLHS